MHWYWSHRHKHTCKKKQSDLFNISAVFAEVSCSWENDPRNLIYCMSPLVFLVFRFGKIPRSKVRVLNMNSHQILSFTSLFIFYTLCFCLVSEGVLGETSEMNLILKWSICDQRSTISIWTLENFSSDSPFYISILLLHNNYWLICVWFCLEEF